MAERTAQAGSVKIGYNGRFYWWTNGGAKHSYHAKGAHADQAQKFRYALAQELASQQRAQELIDEVGGPLARDPEQLKQEREIERQAGIRR